MVNAAPAGPLGGVPFILSNVVDDIGGFGVNVGTPQFKVVFDGVRLTDAAMSSAVNPTRISSASAAFTAADVGKGIAIAGTGAAGADQAGTILTVVSANAVTVSFTCLTTVTGATCHYGTQNATGIQAAYTYAGLHGGTVVWPPSKPYYLEASITVPAGVHESAWNGCICLKGISNAPAFTTSGHDHQRFFGHDWVCYGLDKNAYTAGDSFFTAPGQANLTNSDQLQIVMERGEDHGLQYDSVDIGFCQGAWISHVTDYNCSAHVKLYNCKDSNVGLVQMIGTHLTGVNTAGIQLVTLNTTVPAAAHNENIIVVCPVVRDVSICEGVLVHDCDGLTIVEPVALNVAAGVVIGPAPTGGITLVQVCKHVRVIEPTYVGAAAGTLGANSESAIEINGDNRGITNSVTTDVKIHGGTLSGWNSRQVQTSSGWLRLRGALSDIEVSSVQAESGYGNGIYLLTDIGDMDDVTIRSCATKNVLNGAGGQNNDICVDSGTGAITNLRFVRNEWEGAGYGWYINAMNLSAAGWIDGDHFAALASGGVHLVAGGLMLPGPSWPVLGDPYSIASTPTPTVGAAAGTGGSVGAAITAGNDYAGVVRVTTGTSATGTGIMVTVAFSHTLLRAPLAVLITPLDTGGAKYVAYVSAFSTASFVLSCRVAMDAGGLTATYGYQIIGAY